MEKPIDELRPHPLNDVIYGDDDSTDLAESIDEHGILTPLVVTPDGVVISGHRRLLAARKLNMKTVPVKLVERGDALDLEMALIEANRQRVKTNDQKAREYRELRRILHEKESRQGARSDRTSAPIDAEVERPGRKAARLSGMSPRTADRAAAVVEEIDRLAAEGESRDAENLRSALNKSVDRAYHMVRVDPAAHDEESTNDDDTRATSPLGEPAEDATAGGSASVESTADGSQTTASCFVDAHVEAGVDPTNRRAGAIGVGTSPDGTREKTLDVVWNLDESNAPQVLNDALDEAKDGDRLVFRISVRRSLVFRISVRRSLSHDSVNEEVVECDTSQMDRDLERQAAWRAAEIRKFGFPLDEPDLPNEWAPNLEERAAIMEHDGKLSPIEAIAQARNDAWSRVPAKVICPWGTPRFDK